jgi:hypothetical protein
MFPQNTSTEFSKKNYLLTSNDSINRKEDRIFNREFHDPYRYEKKMADIYERESHLNKYNLSTMPLDSFRAPGNFEIDESYRECLSPKTKNNTIISGNDMNNNSNEEYTGNRYKRRDKEKENQNNNYRYNKPSTAGINTKENILDEFSSSLSIGGLNMNMNIVNSPNNKISFTGKENPTQTHNLNNSNQFNNYNNELIYYREMIEKMHTEIGSLNTKLTDIEKNNNPKTHLHHHSSSNNSNSNYNYNNINNNNNHNNSYSNSYISTANFRQKSGKNTIETLEAKESERRKLLDKNKNSDIEINIDMNKDYQYNYTNNYINNNNNNNHHSHNYTNKIDDSSLKNSLSDNNSGMGMGINLASNSYNYNFNNNNDIIKEINTKSENLFKIKKNEDDENTIKSTNKINNNKINKIPSKNNNRVLPRSNSAGKFTPNNKSKSAARSQTPKNKIPDGNVNKNNKKITQIKTISNISNNKHNSSALLSENEALKEKVSELEKKLRTINDQVALDILEKKGKDHLRVELEIWKNRSESLAKNYVETLSNLKKQILTDKTNFLDQIKTSQTAFTSQVNMLKNKYQSTLDKYEINVKKLRKENEELKKKVSKVKEILISQNQNTK